MQPPAASVTANRLNHQKGASPAKDAAFGERARAAQRQPQQLLQCELEVEAPIV